jgi:hypothetical protein
MAQVTGINELINSLGRLDQEVRRGAEAAVRGTIEDVKQTADHLTPVGKKSYVAHGVMHPGYLLSRNQTRMIEKGPTRFIGEYYNDAPYAVAVAFGHHTASGTWVAARDFVTLPFVYGRRRLHERLTDISI